MKDHLLVYGIVFMAMGLYLMIKNRQDFPKLKQYMVKLIIYLEEKC